MIRLISKYTASQPEKQTIALYIFPNISRNNDNHAVKFGQLIEYKMRNNVIQKNVTWGEGHVTKS